MTGRAPDFQGRRACVATVTGSRAEFGLLERTLDRLHGAPWCELRVVVAGLHLEEQFGLTVREVECRFEVATRVVMTPPEDTRRGMAIAVARGIEGFCSSFEGLEPRPDVLLVLGDRTEVVAAALAASYLDIPVAHIHGGDVSGNPVDDLHREIVSRISRLHLAATEKSAKRLRALGVRGRVQVVGAPGLDAVIHRPRRQRSELAHDLGLSGERWIVVVFHANPAHPQGAAEEGRQVLEGARAVGREFDAEVAVIFPNNDAGHGGVLREIERLGVDRRVHVFRSLARAVYLDLVEHSLLLVGNSSSGVIEGAALGVGVVNVGDRQNHRERDGNVVDAHPEAAAVLRAARFALTDPELRRVIESRRTVYGDGHAAERIADELRRFVHGDARPEGAGDAGGVVEGNPVAVPVRPVAREEVAP